MVARDITAEFTNAASSTVHTPPQSLPFSSIILTQSGTELKIGELVKDEHFTLFEAVGALEVCVCRR